MNKQLRAAVIRYVKSVDNESWQSRYGDEITQEKALELLGLVEEVCENCLYWISSACDISIDLDWERDDFKSDSLASESTYGEGSWIKCGPRFGCVHWEGKE